MQAMLFAAGLGTRLRPLTDTMPKALVKVGGEPLLKLQLQHLADAGVGRVVINVHHFADQIEDYLEENDNFGLDITLSYESSQLLDTGGGLRQASYEFDFSAPVLVHNVDILSNLDLRKFYGIALESEKTRCPADAILLVSERKTKRYLLFDDDLRLMGWTNTETGEVKSPYSWLDPDKCRKLAFAGIHIISPRLFRSMNRFPMKFSIIDFYLKKCVRRNIIGYVKDDLRLLDVGKPDTLAQAGTFLSELRSYRH